MRPSERKSFGILFESLHNSPSRCVESETPISTSPLHRPMNNEIALLTQFLESLGPEVSGHSASPLSAEQIGRIREFASGKLGPSERQALLPSILENETALRTLVKTLQAQA